MFGRGLRPRDIRWRVRRKANKECGLRRDVGLYDMTRIFHSSGSFSPDFCFNCAFGRGMEWA